MMGEHTRGEESSLWEVYQTLLVVLATVVAVALFAGAAGAMTDGERGAEASQQFVLDEPVETVDAQTAQFENESDNIVATDAEINVTHLTTQIGESTVSEGIGEGAVADMDLMMVPEQSFAMYTEWGSYYPASGPVSQLAENTDIITESTVSDVENQAFTTIGDFFDFGLEVDGVYDFGCETEERYLEDWPPWEPQEYDWCGWHDDIGTPADDDTLYHIDADTQLSVLDGFDIDRDNSQFDELILTEDGEWTELPTEDRGLVTGLFGDGQWEWTDEDTTAAYQDEESAFTNVSASTLEESLNYIEFSSGADIWGFDSTYGGDEIIRIEYDAPFSSVQDMQPVDPSDDRYSALYTIVDIFEASDADHNMGLVANGDVNQPLTDDYDAVADEIQELEMFGDLEEETMYLNLTDGLESAASELAESGEHDNQTIVFVGSAHEPMVPDDEWYEVALDSVRDAIIPEFLEGSAIDWGEQAADRPDRAEAGAELDDELKEAASEIADEDGVDLVTMGIGDSHDAARLGMMADEANESTACQDSGLDDSDCNYISVENTGDIESELIDLLFKDDLEFEISRNHVDVNVVGDVEVEDVFTGVNDPAQFTLDNHDSDDASTAVLDTDDDVAVGDDLSFELEIAEPEACTEAVAVEEEFAEVALTQEHLECDDAGDILTSTDTNIVFNDGDDLSRLDELPEAAWIERATDVINETYDDFVDDGELDLEDSAAGTTGSLVGIPVAGEDVEGYSLLHVEMERAPTTDFQVEIKDEKLNESNDNWEEINDDREGKPAGKSVDVDVTVTNYGDDGEEYVLLKNEGGSGASVVDDKQLELDADESENLTLTWETTDADAGYNADMIVQSESDRETHPIELFGPGLNLNIDEITVDEHEDNLDADENINVTQLTDDAVPVNVTVENTGIDGGTAPVALQIGETVYSQTVEFDELGKDKAIANVSFAWQPNYGDIEDVRFADETVGGEVLMQANTVGDTESHTQEVVYVPPDQEIDLDELEDGDIEPVDIDIDEVEIE